MPVRLGLEGSRCEHGTQADGLCANIRLGDSLILPDSPGNACSSNAPGRAPSARIQSPPWRRLTIRKLRDFSLPDTYKRWHGPMECALPAFQQTPLLVARRFRAAAPPDQPARHLRLQKLGFGPR